MSHEGHAHAQQPQVQAQPQVDPIILNIANYLRDNAQLKRRQGSLQGSNVEFYRVKRAVRALLSEEYKKKSGNPRFKLPQISDTNQAKTIIAQLINSRLTLPAEKLHTADARAKGLSPKKGTPSLVLQQKTDLNDNQYLVWFYTKRSTTDLLKGLGVVVGAFTLILFPLWPLFMRRGVWYLSMLLLGLIALFFVIAILRLIFFVISLVVLKPGVWIFPNLFEDVGFFDSFKPLYGWNEPKQKKTKKSKKDSATSASNEEKNAAATATAQTTSAQPVASNGTVKRKAVLEEVEE
jgi:translocation protein SEC62